MNLEEITNLIEKILPKIPLGVITLLFSYIVIKFLSFIIARLLKLTRIKKSMRQIFVSMMSVILWIIAIIFFLKSLGLTGLAVALSGSVIVIGLALANGAKELTSDIISGIFLSQDKDFMIGDEIKVGEVTGVIESIDFRKTRIKDKSGKLHVLPNSYMEKNIWTVKKSI